MEIILAESIANLGAEGDIVKVKGGYARNFLIPQGLAFAATSANAAALEHTKRMMQDKRKRQLKTEQDFANRISSTMVKIHVKAGEEDRLFGSVTAQNIADALAEKGIPVDRRKIQLDEPIKALGVYTVPVRFSSETSGELKVLVEKEV